MSLEDTLSNMTIYDAKKYFRKAQNVVFNYTEMEAKVREATNNEPWGASSSLMEQISQGTYNLREREEILGMIFRRFTEKGANEWRQIYKALQLLDYLIRHGSERFIDDTRSSINLIKMLESFHYVDSQGRDQGINVRNRAKALSELLGDDETIRSERKKARETSKKYQGVAGGLAAGRRPRAGFQSGKAHGISVSADTDDEEEEQGDQPSNTNFRDGSPALQESRTSDDLFSFKKPSDLNGAKHQSQGDDEDEDEDDFADFQSAAPAAPAVKSLSDISMSEVSVHNLLGNTSSAAGLTSSSAFNIGPAISETKKADPFGSLFTNAKNVQEPTKKSNTVQEKQPLQVPAGASESDDEDGFGEMIAAGPSQEPHVNPPPSSNEIDLLSF